MKHLLSRFVRGNRPTAVREDEPIYKNYAEDRNYQLRVLMCMSSITQF